MVTSALERLSRRSVGISLYFAIQNSSHRQFQFLTILQYDMRNQHQLNFRCFERGRLGFYELCHLHAVFQVKVRKLQITLEVIEQLLCGWISRGLHLL